MDDTVRTRSGKRIFGGVLFIGILVGGGLGLIIGGSPEMQHVTLFDIVRLHPTSSSMALYGMAVTTVALSVFFGLVVLLSRMDQSKV